MALKFETQLRQTFVQIFVVKVTFPELNKLQNCGIFGLKKAFRRSLRLNRRTEQRRRTVAANMSSLNVDCDIGGSPDSALGPGPGHEETLPWAWVRFGP